MNYFGEELTFLEHNDRQVREVEAPSLCEKKGLFRFGRKFRLVNGKWVPSPYRGFALVSMVKDNSENDSLFEALCDYQQQLLKGEFLDQIYPLPPESFHQTIANFLSGNRYSAHIEAPGLRTSYPEVVGKVLRKMEPSSPAGPLVMHMLGLSIFGSAFGVLGIISSETDYQKMIHLRNRLYHSPQMNRMGIQRTRPFIGHITLGYFGEDFVKNEIRQKLFIEKCISLNQNIQKGGWKFTLHAAQLRRYENLSLFEHPNNYPEWVF
jgi:hypothetical protein